MLTRHERRRLCGLVAFIAGLVGLVAAASAGGEPPSALDRLNTLVDRVPDDQDPKSTPTFWAAFDQALSEGPYPVEVPESWLEYDLPAVSSLILGPEDWEQRRRLEEDTGEAALRFFREARRWRLAAESLFEHNLSVGLLYTAASVLEVEAARAAIRSDDRDKALIGRIVAELEQATAAPVSIEGALRGEQRYADRYVERPQPTVADQMAWWERVAENTPGCSPPVLDSCPLANPIVRTPAEFAQEKADYIEFRERFEALVPHIVKASAMPADVFWVDGFQALTSAVNRKLSAEEQHLHQLSWEYYVAMEREQQLVLSVQLVVARSYLGQDFPSSPRLLPPTGWQWLWLDDQHQLCLEAVGIHPSVAKYVRSTVCQAVRRLDVDSEPS
ncbi:MAG: hypothetical protein AAF648_14185 [Pseudomonadota bacterium]